MTLNQGYKHNTLKQSSRSGVPRMEIPGQGCPDALTEPAREPSLLEFPEWPSFDNEDIEAVNRVLRSGKVNYWSGGECAAFEREFSEIVGTRYAISLMNGSVALELALMAVGVEQGDEVIVTSRSLIASASAIALRGAVPVFADVDPLSQNITAESIEPLITDKTTAIVAVHLAGWPCEMDPIMELAERRNIKVVEDCAQALGATYKGRAVGSLGDVAVFSFCQDKIMTTGGEGGMLTTNDTETWEKSWSYKDHGKNYEKTMQPNSTTGFRLIHDSIGTNLRMTEMQAALGRVALNKLPKWLAARRLNAGRLTKAFSSIPGLRVTVPPDHINHSYYKYYTFIAPDRLSRDAVRDDIMMSISNQGVPCFSGSCSEIYRERAFAASGYALPPERLPVARDLGETSLVFLVHPTLMTEHIDKTIDIVQKAMQAETAAI